MFGAWFHRIQYNMKVDAIFVSKKVTLFDILPDVSGALSPTLILGEGSRNTPIHDVWISDAGNQTTINGRGYQKDSWCI